FNLDRVQSSSGLSSGGAGILPVNDTSFPGEFVDSYELGLKTTWNDGSLLFNATLFHQKYEDFQLNSFLGTSFVVRSIPEVTSKGVDAELLWQPRSIPGLMFQGGLMYADTTFGDDIPGGDFVEPTGALYKLPGATMPFAPDLSGSASVSYDRDLSNGLKMRFNLGGKYMAGYNTGSDLDVEKYQDAYTVLNARVGLGSANGRWMLELWATNLADTEYVQVGFDGPLQNVSPLPNNPFNTFNAFLGAPRMYGATLRVSYWRQGACRKAAGSVDWNHGRLRHPSPNRRRTAGARRNHRRAPARGPPDPGHGRKLDGRLDRQGRVRHRRFVGLVRLRPGHLQLRGQAGVPGCSPGDPGGVRRGQPRTGAGNGVRGTRAFGRQRCRGGHRHRRAGRRHCGQAGGHGLDRMEAARGLPEGAGVPVPGRSGGGAPPDRGRGTGRPGALQPVGVERRKPRSLTVIRR